MCCHRQHPRARAWGFECIHCGTWLDIGRAPDEQEIADNCQPCNECEAKRGKHEKTPVQHEVNWLGNDSSFPTN